MKRKELVEGSFFRTIATASANVGMGALIVLVVLWWIAFACGFRSYIVMSGSMEPDIGTGSICFVDTGYSYDQLREGDVVAFRHGGDMVTHRVVTVTEEGLETKGDANDRSDGITVTENNFHGKTIFSIPYVGYVIHSLRQPQTLWIAGIALAGLFLWDAVDKKWP